MVALEKAVSLLPVDTPFAAGFPLVLPFSVYRRRRHGRKVENFRFSRLYNLGVSL